MNGDAPITRRDFVGGATLATIGVAVGPRLLAASERTDTWEMYVGTYTAETKSRGIYRMTVDRANGAMRESVAMAASENPSFITMTPDRKRLVAVNELTSYKGEESGAVTLFARDLKNGRLTARAERSSQGGAPCYVSIDRSGRYALIANYVGGSVTVLPIEEAGTLGKATAHVQHSGRGPNAARQTSPHAHCIMLDPANRFVLVADLGIDRVRVYRFDASTGALLPAPRPEVVLRPGAGPRHIAFAPDGKTVYVVNELDSTLLSFDYDAERGALAERQRLSTRAAAATGDNFPADLHVHPSGRTVYATNRGDNTIAVFAVAPRDGRLSLVENVPTGGDWPRNFALSPDGRILLVANQRSNSIVAFRVDPTTGRLKASGERIEIPAPVCLLFTEGERGEATRGADA